MKYGIIYLWYDRKHRRFYLGRHWGTEDDGYVCSSTWMKQAFKRRPHDFKRRVLKRIYSSQSDLIVEEQYWLDMIKPEECGIKYYNKTLRSTAPSMRGRKHSEETKKKISAANKGKPSSLKGKPRSEEFKKWLSENHTRPALGVPLTKEHKKKISEAHKGTKKPWVKGSSGKRTEEAKQRMSDAQKGTKKPWVKGRKYLRDPEKTREKMRAAALIREQKKRENRQLNSLTIM